MKINGSSLALIGFISIFSIFIYNISDIVIVFLVAFILSYLLLPICNRLQNYTNSRIFASILSIFAVYVILGAFVLLLPYLALHFKELFAKLPYYTTKINQRYVATFFDFIYDRHGNLKGYIDNKFEDISVYLFNFSKKLIKSSINLMNIISFLFILPIISYYFLKDWSKVKNNLQSLIPHSYRPPVIKIASEVAWQMSNYIRGQALSCFILAILYSSTLYLIKLDYGFVIGCIVGFFSFIPFIGHIFGLLISLIIGFIQYGSIKYLGLITITFLILNLVENNFITPKLIGERVGLHPLWMIFAFMAGGSAFGFWGIVFSLPITTVLNVIVKFIFEKYKKSRLYE